MGRNNLLKFFSIVAHSLVHALAVRYRGAGLRHVLWNRTRSNTVFHWIRVVRRWSKASGDGPGQCFQLGWKFHRRHDVLLCPRDPRCLYVSHIRLVYFAHDTVRKVSLFEK